MSDDINIDTDTINAVELATDLTIAWLANSNNRIAADDVPAFLNTMHQTLKTLGSHVKASSAATDSVPDYTPAVSVRKSLASPDHIISMIDGKPYRTLRRHIGTHGLTPDQYRERYNLKPDYPMVAPTYSESRRETAKKIGLGRKPKSAADAANSGPAKTASRSKAEG